MYQTQFRSYKLTESKVILLDIIVFRSCEPSENMDFRHEATEVVLSRKEVMSTF